MTDRTPRKPAAARPRVGKRRPAISASPERLRVVDSPPAAAAQSERLTLKPVSVIDALATSLRKRVLDGQLTPKVPLPELELATQYGVARPTIRAAIQQLTLTGLLRREANRSAFVPT